MDTELNRREFLRWSSVMAAASAMASTACQVPQELTVPFHDMPENLVDGMGRARFFNTVIDGAPVTVRTREGRPILVTPRPTPVAGRGLAVRHQAAVLDLYDPDRARGPVIMTRVSGMTVASNWNAIGSDVITRLRTAGNRAVLLTGPIDSPALLAVIAAITKQTGMRHVMWSPLSTDAVAIATNKAFGRARGLRPIVDKADLLLGLGAEFLDRPLDGYELAFASRRAPDRPGAPMNRFIQIEGRLTLTGANADRRIRVRDSQLAMVAAALAHELIVVKQLGPLAADAFASQALTPFAIDAVAPAVGVTPQSIRDLAAELATARGRALVLAGGSASTSVTGVALEVAALALNVTLDAFDAGFFRDTGAVTPPVRHDVLTPLVADMKSGDVQVLIVAGANPVYDAPPGLGLVEALSKVPFIVSLNDRIDETASCGDALAPASHAFECWGDAALPDGVLAIQQPVIQPLFDTRGLLDVLVDWAALLDDPDAKAVVTEAMKNPPAPAAATGQRAPSTSLAWRYLRAQWGARLSIDPASPQFETAWTAVLRDGMWQAPVAPSSPWVFAPGALSALSMLKVAKDDGVELQLYPHLALHDGRSANNGWLHDLPDPITRIAWGGALSIAPRRFDAMQLANGDLVEITSGATTLVAPAYRHAGMHDNQVALPLGFGRSACGPIGAGVGPNAFTLQAIASGGLVASGLPVTLRKTGGVQPLADGQGADVLDRDRRPIVPVTTLTEYERNPRAGTEQDHGGESAWPEHEYPQQRWAMAIDLAKCNGCGKCVVGCQAENNIPVVGHRNIVNGRPMAWLRIDRYYDAPKKDGGWDADVWDGPLEVVEEPQTMFEPMLCQHCENAPCESVCPFSATMHSDEGLNQQIYNRCVGTRYCGNNCPFKVRRFNYFEFSKAQESGFFQWLVPRIARNAEMNTREPMPMKNNPEVTVRSRGVMEKCSFCVQRINAARAEAAREGRAKDRLPDGAVVPACMEACPTGAITFGNINDPQSRVAQQASNPRAMKLLDALGVKPSVSYLSRVRNDKA